MLAALALLSILSLFALGGVAGIALSITDYILYQWWGTTAASSTLGVQYYNAVSAYVT